MKKIPVLFKRDFLDNHTCVLKEEPSENMEEVLKGNCIATVKLDGSCTAIIGGVFYKRYDAKNGKTPPEGAIPCCEPDPVTGHWPHWVKVNEKDKWLMQAYHIARLVNKGEELEDGTYEAIGEKFNNNPYGFDFNVLWRHGSIRAQSFDYNRISFDYLKEYLEDFKDEGIVFWDKEMKAPICKIRRKDFGYKWPLK